MTQWHYADRQRRRIGPISPEEIAALFRNGHLSLDMLVWREGLPQWQPLRAVADELGLLSGLDDRPQPPPLPGAAPLPPPRMQTVAPATAGMSRGVLALIIAAAVAIPLIAILGILAAIALPAYQDYTLRAKVQEPITAASPLKASIAAHVDAQRTCPSNEEAGFQAAETYAGRYVEQIVIGEFDDGTCGMEVRVRGTGSPKLDGKAIWFEYHADDERWVCSSEIEDRWLPSHCRG